MSIYVYLKQQILTENWISAMECKRNWLEECEYCTLLLINIRLGNLKGGIAILWKNYM